MPSLKDVKVGDKLYIVPAKYSNNSKYDPWEEKVSRVGRVWVNTENRYNPSGVGQRYQIETGAKDCGKYLSDCWAYPSKAAYTALKEKDNAWTQFKKELPNSAPEHLTTERIYCILSELTQEKSL